MVRDDPTDDDILQADAVILVDAPRNWEEPVGPARHVRLPVGRSVHDMGYMLRIPVDSTDRRALDEWRERIASVRDHRTQT
jgi:hypothetical protein